MPPSVEYWYPVTADPPSEACAQVMLMVPFPREVVVMAGWPGTVAGVAVRELEASDGPTALTARTMTVSAAPLTSPPMVNEVAAEPVEVHDWPPSRDHW